MGHGVGKATNTNVEIVEPEYEQTGFAVQLSCGVIKRTIGWIGRCRPMVSDREAITSSACEFFVLTAAMILIRRIA